MCNSTKIFWRCFNIKQELPINGQIRAKEVQLIDEQGEKRGVMPLNDALDIAYDKKLDLVLVAPNAQPPVCKIMNYGKYKFDQKKKAREAKKNQSTTEIKGLRLSPVIDKHDFETKLKNVTKWIEHGDRVKIDMRFRGRMITRQEVGKQVMDEFVNALAEIATVDKKPALEGNILSVVLSPKKK